MNEATIKTLKDLADRVSEGDKAIYRIEHAIKLIDNIIAIAKDYEWDAYHVIFLLKAIKDVLTGESE